MYVAAVMNMSIARVLGVNTVMIVARVAIVGTVKVPLSPLAERVIAAGIIAIAGTVKVVLIIMPVMILLALAVEVASIIVHVATTTKTKTGKQIVYVRTQPTFYAIARFKATQTKGYTLASS